jgi:hypothetical protein
LNRVVQAVLHGIRRVAPSGLRRDVRHSDSRGGPSTVNPWQLEGRPSGASEGHVTFRVQGLRPWLLEGRRSAAKTIATRDVFYGNISTIIFTATAESTTATIIAPMISTHFELSFDPRW